MPPEWAGVHLGCIGLPQGGGSALAPEPQIPLGEGGGPGQGQVLSKNSCRPMADASLRHRHSTQPLGHTHVYLGTASARAELY